MRRFAAVTAFLISSVACSRAAKNAPWLTYPDCSSCHGDFKRGTALNASAPPFDVSGNVTTAARGVGAHEKHLDVGVACAECHPVPYDPMHSDGVVDVTFGPVGATLYPASWDTTTLTCSTYCHGNTTAGGTLKTPVWTRVDGTQAACGTCHGVPPPSPHVQNNDCGGCHPGYTATAVNPLTHIDGQIQTTGGCTMCHGDPNAAPAYAAAPPRDTQGNVVTSAPGVGAHLAHLAPDAYYGAGKGLTTAVACTECHPVVDPSKHPDRTLHVTFGPLAAAAGASPVWTPATLTCATTYCHGSAAMGRTAAAPVWNRLDGTETRCTTCHGMPPPSPHPDDATCGDCHKGYTSTTVVAATHIDGVIDMDPNFACTAGTGCTCTTCHGDPRRIGVASSSAPPRDTHGNTLTSFVGVGAHGIHLDGGPASKGVSCTECHPVPDASVKQGAHQNGLVDLQWGPLSSTSTVASWNAAAATCTNYCHGATLKGGADPSPVWTTVDGTQTTCGSCHGNPPPKPHVQRTDCGTCHPGSTSTSVNVSTHVNANIDTVTLTCTICHGTASLALVAGADPRTPDAPPKDTLGNTAASARGVGAHLQHLNPSGTKALATPTQCAECHVVPSSMTHANGTVNMTFGTLSNKGVVASYNSTAMTCTNYCHGATLSGGTATAPLWTNVDGTQVACTSCHGNPPNTGKHSDSDHKKAGCVGCHAGYGATTVNVAQHVDGLKQTGNKVTAYTPSTRTCTNTCHGNKGTW
jgi:predicted CxxxxCH...CXXCH cytochrome family protein